MRRRSVAVAVLVLIALVACSDDRRPEGIVERWLLSLNQGAAGRPGTYAPAEVSEQVVPGWDELEPGELDVIEVGRAAPGEGGIDQVAFRIVAIGGQELRGLANVDAGRVVGIVTSAQTPVGPLPSEGGPSGLEPLHAAAWLVAIVIAGGLIALTWGLMSAVRRRTAPG